jgi:hypothetical protein
MTKTIRKCPLIAIAIILIISEPISAISAQENRNAVSLDELLQWISDDDPENSIISRITERKIDFEPNIERMERVKSLWKKTKKVDLPSHVASSILKSYTAPKAVLDIACMKECELFAGNTRIGEASPAKSLRTSVFSPGELTVTAKAGGYRDERMKINLKGGQLNILAFDDFLPLGGGIQLTCEPKDCQVFLNDKPVTMEQLAFPNISEGRYNIQAKKEGWASDRQKVTISPGQTVQINLLLKKVLMPLPNVESVIEAILEPFMPDQLNAELNCEGQGEFKLKEGEIKIAGRIRERIQGDQITWEMFPELRSGYKQVTVKYERHSSPQIAKSAEKDIHFAEAMLTYIKRMLETNPREAMKRVMLGGGLPPRVEWWDEQSMKPFTGVSKKWWEEGSLKLIAEYSEQKSVMKISKTPFDEFPVISELHYTGTIGIAPGALKTEFYSYQGLNPFWPNRIILFSAQGSDDGLEIHYDSNSPRSLASK